MLNAIFSFLSGLFTQYALPLLQQLVQRVFYLFQSGIEAFFWDGRQYRSFQRERRFA